MKEIKPSEAKTMRKPGSNEIARSMGLYQAEKTKSYELRLETLRNTGSQWKAAGCRQPHRDGKAMFSSQETAPLRIYNHKLALTHLRLESMSLLCPEKPKDANLA